MPVSCQVIVELIEKLAPKREAEDWDNVGLQVGHPADKVSRVLVTLDLTEPVALEAIDQGVDMIVTHHPLIFRPLKQVRFDLPEGKLIQLLIKKGIAVYAVHTNLDNCAGGVNTILADLLGLKDIEVLEAHYGKLVKIAVYVPRGYEEQVRQALCDNGGGWIGNYSDCTFSTAGEGTFRPREGANPFIGKRGDLERAGEFRLETIVREQDLARAVKAMIKAHPYEEVAYDLYPLLNEGKTYGMGRIGRLPAAVTLGRLGEIVGEALEVAAVRIAGNPDQLVTRVAVCGGSGGSFVHRAAFAGAEVLVTGDVKHHEGLDALARGLAVIDAGHYGTERPVVPVLARYLREELGNWGRDVDVAVSTVNTDPFNQKVLSLSANAARRNPETDRPAAAGVHLGGTGSTELVIYTDGASRGNPGPAAIGVVIVDQNGAEMAVVSEFLGDTTNNVAEYTALIRGLEEAFALRADRLTVRMDSELVVKQLKGQYQVKHPGLQQLHRKAREMVGKFKAVAVEHVPREKNKRADALANEALDRRKG